MFTLDFLEYSLSNDLTITNDCKLALAMVQLPKSLSAYQQPLTQHQRNVSVDWLTIAR